MFLLSPQYDYEYDEHGERVVLGKGTFGVVYAGRDLSNQVRLAIKEIPERDSRSEKQPLWGFFGLCVFSNHRGTMLQYAWMNESFLLLFATVAGKSASGDIPVTQRMNPVFHDLCCSAKSKTGS